MAIFHLSVKTVSRSAGRSATASAAYRAGERIACERTGEVHDYRRKAGVESADLVLPASAPEWAADRSALWNAAEQKESRKNSTVAREFEIALPSELSAPERRRLALDLAREIVERHGCAADVAIHAPSKAGDERNHHAHILVSTRRLVGEGFTEKTRELDDMKTGPQLVVEWRERFAVLANERLAEAGLDARVDHRSLAEQGIDRAPTEHMGPAATGYERRTGERSRRGQAADELSAGIREQLRERAQQEARKKAEEARKEAQALERIRERVEQAAARREAEKAQKEASQPTKMELEAQLERIKREMRILQLSLKSLQEKLAKSPPSLEQVKKARESLPSLTVRTKKAISSAKQARTARDTRPWWAIWRKASLEQAASTAAAAEKRARAALDGAKAMAEAIPREALANVQAKQNAALTATTATFHEVSAAYTAAILREDAEVRERFRLEEAARQKAAAEKAQNPAVQKYFAHPRHDGPPPPHVRQAAAQAQQQQQPEPQANRPRPRP